MKKPQNPWPPILRLFLRRVLPHQFYRRYIGRHEDASLAIWRRLARVIPLGTAILDIGAFRGEFSLAARDVNPSAKVFAFEPNPSNLEKLRAECDSRGIEIVAGAVAEKGGVVRFVCDSAHSHIAASCVVASGSSPQKERELVVPVVALDTWTAECSVIASLIKIDVEGAESAILRGARNILRYSQPIILCEVLSDSDGERVMAELPAEYRYWYIDENTGASERPRITRKYWRNKNWLLVPESKNTEIATHNGSVYITQINHI